MPDLSEFSGRWRFVGHAWPIVATACLGLAVAVSAWFAVSIWEERLARAKFNAVAGDYASILQNGLDDFLGGIYALRAFYDSSHQVDRNEFALFTSQFNRNQSDIMRLIWCPRVTREQRAAFEHAQKENDLAIETWSLSNPPSVSPERDEYFPVLYSTVASQTIAATRSSGLVTETPWQPRKTFSCAIQLAGSAAASSRFFQFTGKRCRPAVSRSAALTRSA